MCLFRSRTPLHPIVYERVTTQRPIPPLIWIASQQPVTDQINSGLINRMDRSVPAGVELIRRPPSFHSLARSAAVTFPADGAREGGRPAEQSSATGSVSLRLVSLAPLLPLEGWLARTKNEKGGRPDGFRLRVERARLRWWSDRRLFFVLIDRHHSLPLFAASRKAGSRNLHRPQSFRPPLGRSVPGEAAMEQVGI